MHPLASSYEVADGVIFLAIVDRTYPRKLAFSYLAEVHRTFAGELQAEHGASWRAQIDTTAKPYAFLRFGAFGIHRPLAPRHLAAARALASRPTSQSPRMLPPPPRMSVWRLATKKEHVARPPARTHAERHLQRLRREFADHTSKSVRAVAWRSRRRVSALPPRRVRACGCNER